MNNIKLKTICVCLIILSGLLTNVHAAEQDGRRVEMVVGNPRTINIDYQVGDSAVGKSEICDYVVRPSRKEIVLNPQAPGITTLMLWDTRGIKKETIKLVVRTDDLSSYVKRLKGLIGEVKGVDYRVVDNQIVIDGKVSSEEDLSRIRAAVAESPQVLNLVTLSDERARALAKQIETTIGSDEISARAIRGKVVLEGTVYNKWEKERADKLANVFTDGIVNLIEVRKADHDPRAEKTIQIIVHFVEISNQAIRGFQVQWGGRGNTEVSWEKSTSSSLAASISGTLSNLLPMLNYAVEKGAARVLEQASLISKSGSSGEVFGGGEIGIPVSQGYGSVTIDFKEVGVHVKVKPVVISGGIDLVSEIEVSALANMNIGGLLTIQKSRLACHEFIIPGQSIALGGLISNRVSKVKNRVPTDGGNFLFRLYASRDFQQKRSQFVIFLTPKILEQPVDSSEELNRWREHIISKNNEDGIRAK